MTSERLCADHRHGVKPEPASAKPVVEAAFQLGRFGLSVD